MKFTKYFMPFAALALLASCSNDNVDQPKDNPASKVGDKTYMNISVSMPNVTGSRAVEYDDGLAKEYALDNGYVYLFSTKTVSGNLVADQLVAKGELPVDDLRKAGTTDDITGVINFYGIEVDNTAQDFGDHDGESVNYMAMIILNVNEDAITEPGEGDDWSDWANGAQEKAMKYTDNGKEYFTMTNALGWSGAAASIATAPGMLVSVTEDNLYHNDADKYLVTPVEFFVQRGVAKVTINNSTDGKIKVGDEATVTGRTSDKVTLSAWTLDITNKSGFPVQKIVDDQFTFITDWTYNNLGAAQKRFVGTSHGTNNVQNTFNRVFWAVDPNYSSGSSANFNCLVGGAEDGTDLDPTQTTSGNDYPQYCLENTFDLDNMNKNVSTRVVFKANYKANGQEGSFVCYGPNFYNVTSAYPVKVTKSGSYAVKDLFDQTDTEKYNAVLAELKATDNTKVDYYLNGDCYYTVIIRHFEESECKDANDSFWDSWYFRGDYGVDETHYLGRYGMVRNNWYDVIINKISGPGEPTIPDPDEPEDPEPDDDPDPYKIDVTINILSWAKRSHSYDL